MVPDGAHAAAVVVGGDGRGASRGQPIVPLRIFFPGNGLDIFIAAEELDHSLTGVAIMARGSGPHGWFVGAVDEDISSATRAIKTARSILPKNRSIIAITTNFHSHSKQPFIFTSSFTSRMNFTHNK